MKKLDEYVNRSSKRVGRAEKNSEISGVNGEEWDWECWKKHFTEVEEEERLISVSEVLSLFSLFSCSIVIQDSSHAISNIGLAVVPIGIEYLLEQMFRNLVKNKLVPDPFYGLGNESIIDIVDSLADLNFWAIIVLLKSYRNGHKEVLPKGMFRGHLGGVLLISPTFYPSDYPGRISPQFIVFDSSVFIWLENASTFHVFIHRGMPRRSKSSKMVRDQGPRHRVKHGSVIRISVGRLEQALALISEVHGDEQHILSQYFYGSLVTVSYDKGSQKRHCQESNL
ncbi:hypothetical protein BC332_15995 [Capsicum chinense]|nr:hypothetical protein BC332_15995 [Capsicum chinense]